MSKRSTLWVGIDDDKKKLTAGVVRGTSKELRVDTIPNEDGALRRWVRRLVREADGGSIRMCYEAGPNGFSLKRRLEALGEVAVEVVAPNLTPRRVGQRVKTDRTDARRLVELYRARELKVIGVPQGQDEAARDLVRLLHKVGRETTAKRHQIQHFLIRRGRIWRDGENWTLKYRAWARGQGWETWTDQTVFEELWMGLDALEEQRARLLVSVERLAQEEHRSVLVGVLRCFRGVDTIGAMTLITELFDVQRFGHPRQLMAYLGLTVGVQQSGEKEYRGGITKIGNRESRWILGQAALAYRHPPQVTRSLRQRRTNQPTWAIAIADRAARRLNRRYWYLIQRGKSPQKAVIAIARELTAFLWEAMMEAPRRQSLSQQAA